MDQLIETTATRIFMDHGADTAGLWQALTDTGLTRAWLPEDQGGGDLAPADAFGLIRLSGAAARPVPFAETLLAGFLLSQSGMDVPDGALSIAMAAGPDHLAVPFGGEVAAVVEHTGARVTLWELSQTAPAETVGGDPETHAARAQASLIAQGPPPPWLTQDVFTQICALARAAQMCGAMQGVLDLTLGFTAEREQFGRPLSKFQAIQHMLSEMAGELAASLAALQGAVETVQSDGPPDVRGVAAAKIRASEAAGIVAAHAHQAHGAIGYTGEYDLARYTRRLWRWREQFGNETEWAITLGRALTSPEAADLTTEIFGDTND